MEEKLASIREMMAQPRAAGARSPDSAEQDVLELTDVVEDKPPSATASPGPASQVRAPVMPSTGEALLSDQVAAAAVASLSTISSHVRQSAPAVALGNPGVTLEQVTRDLLRPMLKEWLDANLPALVERLVSEEIDRLSRYAR